MRVDKDDFQQEQQRHDHHARAKLTQTTGTDFHHAVGDKAKCDPLGDGEAERHHHGGNKRRYRFGEIIHFTRARLEVISTPT